MTHFPQSNLNQRSPRVQLHGSVAAAVMAQGGQRARAKLQTISVTGGLLQLQHQLSAQIGHYMDGEEIKVYPIDVFAQILFEKAIQYQILPFLRGAINRAKTGM